MSLSQALNQFAQNLGRYPRSTVDPQDLQSAFQNYMRSAHTDLVKLMNYAREFRLVNVMRPYLEAVMPAWFTGEFIL